MCLMFLVRTSVYIWVGINKIMLVGWFMFASVLHTSFVFVCQLQQLEHFLSVNFCCE